MSTEVQGYIDQGSEPDSTWEIARLSVQKHLQIPPTLPRVVKTGWEGLTSQDDFLKLVGGARVNAGCLLSAAQIMNDGRKPNFGDVVNALNTLGMGYASVVMAVNTLTRRFLKSKPAPLWKSVLKEMMSSIEIGYILGSKVSGFGSAAGALMGFAEHAGLLMLCMDDPKAFKEWRFQSQRAGRLGRKVEVGFFGCEPYQVAALTIQALGFGVESAVGTALGVGRLSPEHLAKDDRINCWRAAVVWIDSLKRGRDFPAQSSMRDFFKEITPSKDSATKNLTLGVLYTEVAKVKNNGSDWTWHLPLPSYDATQEEWKLN